LFLGFVLAGIGMLFRAVRGGSGACLASAAILFALAATTRTTGAAFLLLAPMMAFFDRRLSWRARLTRSGLSIVAMALVLLTAMAGNWARNGRFEIGSFGGVSLLGKGLILIEPADLRNLPKGASFAAAATLAPAVQARASIADAPDLASAMRAQMQSTEDLRFAVFFPAAAKTWTEFAAADWRERAVVSSHVALLLIAAHPHSYARLWLRDWTGLLLYPNFWPGWATSEPRPRSQFPACFTQENCYSLDRYDLPAGSIAWLLLVSLGGAIGGALVILTRASAVLHRRADPNVVLFFGLAIILHLSLLVTAAAEVSFVRYSVALHVLDVALVLWLLLNGLRRVFTGRPRNGAADAPDGRATTQQRGTELLPVFRIF
jgi:hypothetical protein